MDPKKIVLVTGSSCGLGRLTVETMARRGYTVFASMRESTGRNAGASAQLRTLAEKEGLAIRVIELDVTEDSSVALAVKQVIDQVGRIDVLINNASMASMGLTEAFALDQAQRIFGTNFFGVVRMDRAVLPQMRRQGSGLLVHLSTICGRLVLPFMGLYCASKFALEALAEAYRYELSALAIDSVIVEPGGYAAPMFGNFSQPADQGCVAQYGPIAKFPENMAAGFQEFLTGPNGPEPEEVVDGMVRIIETPLGKRPLRTLVGGDVQLTQSLNDLAAETQRTFLRAFGVEELLTSPVWVGPRA